MTELALHLNDPSASIIYLSVDVPPADLSALLSDWMNDVPAPAAESTEDAMEEADWIAGQLARGRKDLFDPRKSHMVLTAAAQAEMEQAVGLFPSADPGPDAPVRSGDVMTFDGSVMVHRSQVLYVAVGRVKPAGKVDAPVTVPLDQLPPPPPPSAPPAPVPPAVAPGASKTKGLFAHMVDAAAAAAKAELARKS